MSISSTVIFTPGLTLATIFNKFVKSFTNRGRMINSLSFLSPSIITSYNMTRRSQTVFQTLCGSKNRSACYIFLEIVTVCSFDDLYSELNINSSIQSGISSMYCSLVKGFDSITVNIKTITNCITQLVPSCLSHNNNVTRINKIKKHSLKYSVYKASNI